MSPSESFRALMRRTDMLFFIATAFASSDPARVVEDSLTIPSGLDTAEALASVEDIASVFDDYDPVVPKIPGVKLDLDKQVVSTDGPTVLELPVSGSAFGSDISERARVTATTRPVVCDSGNGLIVDLDFTASSYNIERRIERIEITACPSADGEEIHAVGRLYAGYKPVDPKRNAISESIGRKALQGAFIKQVPAVFEAVEQQWAELANES